MEVTGGKQMKILGMMLLVAGAAGQMFAGNNAPEIDGSTASAAIALVTGGLVVLRARRKK